MDSLGGGNKRKEIVIKSPPDMALGCFIGVMVLLVLVILFLAFSGNRLNQMLDNQNNTTHALHVAIDAAILLKARNRYIENNTNPDDPPPPNPRPGPGPKNNFGNWWHDIAPV